LNRAFRGDSTDLFMLGYKMFASEVVHPNVITSYLRRLVTKLPRGK
jgi:hypothetical protein